MRIAMITPYFLPVVGGLENHVLEISLELQRMGNEVEALTAASDREGKSLPRNEFVSGVKVRRFGSVLKAGNFARLWPAVLLELAGRRYDVIHVHNYGHPHCDLAALASRITGAPLVMTCHGPWYYDRLRSRGSRFWRRLYDSTFGRALLKSAHTVVALTQGEVPFLLKHGVPPDRVRIVPNGIRPGPKEVSGMRSEVPSTASHCESQSDRAVPGGPTTDRMDRGQAFRQRFGLSGRVVLSIGRIHAHKGYLELVGAARRVVAEMPDVTFVLVGPDGGALCDIKGALASMGLDSSFLLTGTLLGDEKSAALDACDVFVLPSLAEGFGITILEAISHSKPVVVTPSGGPPWVVATAGGGLVAESWSPEDLSQPIVHLLDNPVLCRRMAKTSRRKVDRWYTWKVVAERLQSIYSSSVEGTGSS